MYYVTITKKILNQLHGKYDTSFISSIESISERDITEISDELTKYIASIFERSIKELGTFIDLCNGSRPVFPKDKYVIFGYLLFAVELLTRIGHC